MQSDLPIIALLATSWGTKSGGINSFNMDLTIALSSLLKDKYKIICAVLNASEEQIADAARQDIHLLTLNTEAEYELFSADVVNKLWDEICNKFPSPKVEWWIGHDVISGKAANKIKEVSEQGRSAVIMHMSYFDYTGYKHCAAEAQKKYTLQNQVFNDADKHFAVGPLLRDRLNDLLSKEDAIMLIPGLHQNLTSKKQKSFTAITFGRLDPENDKIKQGKLAVAAFAEAIKLTHAEKSRAIPCLRDNPRMILFGIDGSGSEEEKSLKAFANKRAGRVINLFPLPYTENRKELFEQLCKSSIALMLSWHEGFGLTGWEAISAEIPLIISDQSGLYKFIDEELQGQGIGCVHPISIGGEDGGEDEPNFTEKTLKEVTDIILECANDRERIIINAKALKKNLIDRGYTWERTACTLVEALEISVPKTCNTHFFVTPSSQARKDYSIDNFALLMRKVVCFNQGEFTQYSFLAAEFHKKIKTAIQIPYIKPLDVRMLGKLSNAMIDYLNRTLGETAKSNFGFIEQYFEDRHNIKPRLCIKCSQMQDNEEWIKNIYRDIDINYISDFPLGSNSGFVHVKDTGTFFECNNIPSAIVEGKYKNSRINVKLAKEYWVKSEKKQNSNENSNINLDGVYTPDTDWIECWLTQDGGNDANPTSCYKSTLIIPMTLWNVELDEEFRKVISTNDAGRTIFGFLCFDHVDSDFFTSRDVDVGYVFADILSQYFILRSIYTEFSSTYNRAIELTMNYGEKSE